MKEKMAFARTPEEEEGKPLKKGYPPS